MASRCLKAAAAPERQSLPLYVELLEDIFLLLSSPIDLARVSAACFSFRQVISDPYFLRQHRAVHPPLLLGCRLGRFRLVAAPHPNAAAARSLARVAHSFWFDYLPRGVWCESDICEGRVLVECVPAAAGRHGGTVFPGLAVSDPLSRQYRLLPPIPDDLIVSTQVQKHSSFKFLLVPSGHMEDTSFKVIAKMNCEEKIVVFIFSSQSGNWDVGASTTWSDLGLNSTTGFFLSWPQYKHGCFYWKVHGTNNMLKLDINRMEYSTVDLPEGQTDSQVVIAEAGEGKLAIFCLVCYGTTVNYYTIAQHEGDGSEWQMEKVISLPKRGCFAGASAGYIFLISSEQTLRGRTNPVLYSIEIKSWNVERVCSTESIYGHALPYFGFPPFLSPRRI